ncbi:MAG: hypothetical protein P1V20_32020 [Verrucomicrobiales bacterium]|nr:hypothetical protein [Verrucomicrobiales bacterium]
MPTFVAFVDPNTGEKCSLDRILDHLELQKQTHSQQTKPKILFGLPAWKSKLISRFLVSPGTECDSSRSMRTTRKWESDHPGGEIYTWSLRDGYTASTATSIRTEDGFLRSVGLGANFHAPISLVFDSRGMYFDSTRPSDLEVILNETKFSTSDCERARQLIDSLVRNRITKYNLKSQSEADWGSRDQPKILVPRRQDEHFRSANGQSPCFSNLAFLERVRRENPSSIIAYKPHPDVAEKLRPGSANLDEMKYLCDVLIQDLDIIPWLETCDEVHTLTSQTGFEALLRGKDVTCYGVPFYSGWGLTTDKIHCDRRNRKLRIEELVAGVLMDYPLYLNPNTSEFMTAHDASKFLSSENSVEIFSRPMLFRVTAAVKRLIHPLR